MNFYNITLSGKYCSFISSQLIIVLFALPIGSVQAFESLEGYFIALDQCELFQSKNKGTNPGNRMTEHMRAYQMRGINKPNGDFYQIIVPDAPVTEDRWAHVSCGVHVVDAQTVINDSGPGDDVEPTEGQESTDNVLALSWQPAFCESKPNKTECIDLNNGNLPITERQFSIHGLWAQPRGNTYCGVPPSIQAIDSASQWHLLPAPELSPETEDTLSVLMPGTASFLERHEWIKHGTCHRGTDGAEEYFADTITVTQAINESVVAQFLADHVGATVDTEAIRDKFDDAFGAGAGQRVQFHCSGDQGRVLLQEITINLNGTITSDGSVAELILSANESTLGCPQGQIDASGLQ